MALLALSCVTTLAPARAADHSPRVVVTIKPVHALVAQVMAGVATPDLIVDGGASPHTYALRPSDARKLQAAAVVFRVSETFETFTAKVLRTVPKSTEVVTLEDAPGMTLLPRRKDPDFETHKAHKDHAHTHGKHTSGAERDGHSWLDPSNAIAMVDQIAATLSRKDPERAALYKANAETARQGLRALTSEIERDLKPAAGRPYIVFHDAYQYLEARFGLAPVGSVTTSPDSPPSGKRLAELRKKVASLGAQCVFAEPAFETRVVQSIVEGSAARVGTLDPEATLLTPGPGLYAEMMRKLAAGLRSCLTPSS
jgi:zinc transport system substrate-binding protein